MGARAMKLGDVLRTMRHGEGGQGAEETRDLTEVRSPVGGGSPRQGAGDYVVEEEVQWIPIHIVDPSPFQARRHFDEEAVEELAASIKVHGILQPMIVRPKGPRVELVVGERRLRACRLLGWNRVPAVVRDLDDRAAAEMVMVENLQRRDLNPMEEAAGYEGMLQAFGLTQQELADRLGLSQSAIANKLRLLRLPDDVQGYVAAGKLSERHARALLRLDDAAQQRAMARWAAESGATVRELEARVQGEPGGGPAKPKGVSKVEAPGAETAASAGESGTSGRRSGPGDGMKAAGSPAGAEALLTGLDKFIRRWQTAGIAVQMDVEDTAGAVEIRLRIPKNIER